MADNKLAAWRFELGVEEVGVAGFDFVAWETSWRAAAIVGEAMEGLCTLEEEFVLIAMTCGDDRERGGGLFFTKVTVGDFTEEVVTRAVTVLD